MLNNLLNIYVLIFTPLVFGALILIGFFGSNTIVLRRFSKWFSGLYFLYSAIFSMAFSPNFELDFQGGIFAQSILTSIIYTVFSFVIFTSISNSKSDIIHKHRLFYSMALLIQGTFALTIFTQNICVSIFAFMFEIFLACTLFKNFTHKRLIKYISAYLILNFIGAFLLLVSFLNLGGNFSYLNLYQNDFDIPLNIQYLIIISGFLLASVNMGVFPFHKPIVEIIQNSNPSTFLLPVAQISLGFLLFSKITACAFPFAFNSILPFVVVLCCINILYFCFLAIKEVSLLKSFAYYTISGTGGIICAFCAQTQNSITGSIFEFITKILAICALFYAFCAASKIFKTDKLPLMGGLLTKAPRLSFFTFVFILILIGLPFSSGFFGKFLSTLGGFSSEIDAQNLIRLGTFCTISGYILGAIYLIKAFQQIFFGVSALQERKSYEILRHKRWVFICILVFCVIIGILSNTICDYISNYSDLILSIF